MVLGAGALSKVVEAPAVLDTAALHTLPLENNLEPDASKPMNRDFRV